MDSYTHLYIEDLRPTAEKLAMEWKKAGALRAVEHEAEVPIKRIRETSTFSPQPPRMEKHSPGK